MIAWELNILISTKHSFSNNYLIHANKTECHNKDKYIIEAAMCKINLINLINFYYPEFNIIYFMDTTVLYVFETN